MDVYGLVNPWTDFNNLAFPFPNQGLGVVVQVHITTNLYVLVGFADAKAAITPDIQMLVNPISTTNTDIFAAMGVRVRFAF